MLRDDLLTEYVSKDEKILHSLGRYLWMTKVSEAEPRRMMMLDRKPCVNVARKIKIANSNPNSN